MICFKCGKELRLFRDVKTDCNRYKKYKCDCCNQVTELRIDQNDKLQKVKKYTDKF